jgi:hypothetical protein
LWWVFLRYGLTNYLSRLALNWYPLDRGMSHWHPTYLISSKIRSW